ncbi:MAG: hypothetical protein A2268_07885 [Candidatus Raymondbacteria bacterium RifOxyA12_full_50_37]|uniref:Uncharacterized protein n=1 Tax=Candidatus Raymondbacteria bacterium RIFOXYD12_FULL_49_13 TaxID=1817890 RepID=A0A1F7F7J3_UNCRA|nr:MAG: hypothetical protein A2268_07885 [Candidatus Raymondbacteria bacterium RifOxyA12_full_50_37]OGJ89626.1 MAG: hypothetical protein A2248_09605 [Candidatus Raymondbacteria bacterium RIFOXYA2_FULL_49_16]OGJ92961.1 MAG: hypothetical protein A2487_10225 [Candidatus Raymondbacteria bacterium RifOxyC12_full_50_8]OGK01089.1 MAG: hypothetical protein A2350_13445 [Candidatus Raymondbacteria bacterium RifOxyB12_full_50_8]OGK02644.1 MAG: hypothetical protein A2519_11325 [Candidatus Raymondbacteria b
MVQSVIAALVCLPLICQAYTTWDNKMVPPLPQSGTAVICSTSAQLFMAIRTQRMGTTISIKDGTYNVAPFEPIMIDSNDITIRGESGDPASVILVGKGFLSCPIEEMIKLNGTHTTIADLTLSDVRGNCLKIQSGANHNCLVYNVRFINIAERMIKGPGVPSSLNWEIRYCHFENTQKVPATICEADDNGNYVAGMDIMRADSWVVHDNVFRNIQGATGGGRGAIFFWSGCKNMVAERNTFIGCDRAICYGNPSGTNDVDSGVIRNNFIVRGYGIGIEMENSANIKIYNNTLYSSNSTYFRSVYFGTNGAGNEFRNNIIFGAINGSVQTMSNNISKTLSTDANTNWFAARAIADLHLTASATQAIDAGTGDLVVDDWDGHGRTNGMCDIGADEFGSTRIERTSPAMDSVHGAISVHPNPFNPKTMITLRAPENNEPWTAVKICSVGGKLVKDLTGSQPISSPSSYSVLWDTQGIPSGIYYIYARIGARSYTQKAVLLK